MVTSVYFLDKQNCKGKGKKRSLKGLLIPFAIDFFFHPQILLIYDYTKSLYKILGFSSYHHNSLEFLCRVYPTYNQCLQFFLDIYSISIVFMCQSIAFTIWQLDVWNKINIIEWFGGIS